MDFGAGIGRERGALMYTPITPVGWGRAKFQSTHTSMSDLENLSNTDDAFAAPPQIGCVGLDLPGANEGYSSVHVIVAIAEKIGMPIGESTGTNVAGNVCRSGGTDPSLVNWVVKS